MKARPIQSAHRADTDSRTPSSIPRKDTAPHILSGMFRRAQTTARTNN